MQTGCKHATDDYTQSLPLYLYPPQTAPQLDPVYGLSWTALIGPCKEVREECRGYGRTEAYSNLTLSLNISFCTDITHTDPIKSHFEVVNACTFALKPSVC